MVTVARHEIDVANAESMLKFYVEPFEDKIVGIDRRPHTVLSYMLTNSRNEAACHTVLDPAAARAETWNAVALAMQAGGAIYALTGRTGGEVGFRLGDQDFSQAATGPKTTANPGDWLTAMSLAMICRERPRIDVIAGVPAEALRDSGGQADEFQFDWVKTLQLYWRSEDGLIDSLLRAMQGADPAADTIAGPEMVSHVFYPPMELFYLLTQREDARFTESLTKALELHKAYWTADAERAADPEGFVAWRVLAVACLAKDAGVDITVESGYLPRNLLDGTWVGEKQL
ncbi:Immunity protein 49 [Lentzea xinjiangensis]|uniref:Immunity protein 49 n=1 Tax=Lentzea xinjiangensis TaxID=402600 RepID=A0A1H9G5J2_9PSEU|nr:immunity 49 family protein [Lentzea xinjiangensis]SEQ45260.1 Immunity protein 49 [Lentzea xinjiangensis]